MQSDTSAVDTRLPMSLETLLEAAEYVERESNENKPDCGTRGQSSNSPTSPLASTTSDSDSEKANRRPGGAGTREIHNRLEKNRRAHLKVCYETLKGEIPSLDEKKTSNLNILKSALRYIQNLEKRTRQQLKEREDLQKSNLSLRAKLRDLKTEFKNLIDLNGKNGIKFESSLAIDIAVGTSNFATVSAPTNNVSPVSVATQTMPVAKKVKQEDNTSDEEINVEDVGEP